MTLTICGSTCATRAMSDRVIRPTSCPFLLIGSFFMFRLKRSLAASSTYMSGPPTISGLDMISETLVTSGSLDFDITLFSTSLSVTIPTASPLLATIRQPISYSFISFTASLTVASVRILTTFSTIISLTSNLTRPKLHDLIRGISCCACIQATFKFICGRNVKRNNYETDKISKWDDYG